MTTANQRALRLALQLSLVALAVTIGAAQVTDKDLLNPDPNDFLLYSGTYDSQRHSLLKEINTGNVGSLQAKWIFHLTGAKDLEAPPIVYKGVMYIGQYNRVHALDAATGRLIWEHLRQPPSVGWQRGIGIYGDMVYMVAQDSALVALDRRTGNPIWEARPSQTGKRFQGPMPFAAKGLIIMSGSGQGGGFIEAFDALTGKPKWHWNTIPRSGRAWPRNVGG
jgi:alcohol dehydrogenase (cytochrome c)